MKTKKIAIIVLSVLIIAAVGTYIGLALQNKSDVAPEDLLVTVNGKGVSSASIKENLEMFRFSEKYPDVMWNVSDGWFDERLDYLIESELLKQEAERRGIKGDREEVEQLMKDQPRVFYEAVDAGDPTSLMMLEYFGNKGTTPEEYYAREDTIELMMRLAAATEFLRQEYEAKGAVTQDEQMAVRDEIVKSLRKRAKIVINQENVEKLRAEADEVIGNIENTTEKYISSR